MFKWFWYIKDIVLMTNGRLNVKYNIYKFTTIKDFIELTPGADFTNPSAIFCLQVYFEKN